MGKSTENTPNVQEFVYLICLPKPKSSGSQWKKASLAVRSPWSFHYVPIILTERNLSWQLSQNLIINKIMNLKHFYVKLWKTIET